ncbi:MAG: hypothetical protein HOQ15_01685 [Gemmatimonadaceae bacterium]|nr:hypothetical protein [Gemmatimonadaceae bacterium]
MQITERTIAGIVALSVGVTGLVLANILLSMMIGEINRRRLDDDQVSYFGFTFPKMQRIFAEYRSSYPSGRLNLYALLAFAVAVAGLVITAVCIGIIG